MPNPSLSLTEQKFGGQDCCAIPPAVARPLECLAQHLCSGTLKVQAMMLPVVQYAVVLAEIVPRLQEIAELAETTLYERLINYAWFFDSEMYHDDALQLAAFVLADDEDGINRVMSGHFRSKLDAIASDLAAYHPPHGRLLAQAFSAHREQRYALAIPVFLAQADGISRELLGTEYFVFGKSKNQAESLMRQMAGDDFLKSALRSLVHKGAIRMHTSQSPVGILNRHAVLHGLDMAYDSELNSLKAISLLNFLSVMNRSKRAHLTILSGS